MARDRVIDLGPAFAYPEKPFANKSIPPVDKLATSEIPDASKLPISDILDEWEKLRTIKTKPTRPSFKEKLASWFKSPHSYIESALSATRIDNTMPPQPTHK